MKQITTLFITMFLVFGLVFSSALVLAQNENSANSSSGGGGGGSGGYDYVCEDGTVVQECEMVTTIIEPECVDSNVQGAGPRCTAGSATSELVCVDDPEELCPDNEEPEENQTEFEGVIICHIPQGNPENKHTIKVGAPAVKAHLAHGDYLGACGETETETKGLEIETETDPETNKTKIRVRLSNQERKELKIRSKQAAEIAKQRLRVKNLSRIQLKEKIHKNIPKIIYNIEAEKPGKFLGIFKFAMKVTTEVDAETGEIITTSKPWWAFLVREIINAEEPKIPSNETDLTCEVDEDCNEKITCEQPEDPLCFSNPYCGDNGECSCIEGCA